MDVKREGKKERKRRVKEGGRGEEGRNRKELSHDPHL